MILNHGSSKTTETFFHDDTLPRKDLVGLLSGLLAGSIILKIWDLNFFIFYNSGNLFLF